MRKLLLPLLLLCAARLLMPQENQVITARRRAVTPHTLTLYSDAACGGTAAAKPMDSIYIGEASQPWSVIRTGVTAEALGCNANVDYYIQTSTFISNGFDDLYRDFISFDTSAIPSNATVTSVTLSLNSPAEGISTALGVDTIDIVSSSPVNPANPVASDWSSIGSVVYAAISMSSLVEGNNDFVFNSGGIAHINKGGVTSLALIGEWDRTGVFGGTFGLYVVNGADFDGPTGANPPKLTVNYTTP
jgi:hypothetical protein